MTLKIKNTLTGTVDVFIPFKKGEISMYHCGPTVYTRAHIGNLRAYIFADFLRRFFKYQGNKVVQVINITDVGHLTSDSDLGEDKVEKEAKNRGLKAKQITEEITALFMKDLENLNVNLNEIIFPRATEYIDEQIALIQDLEKAGLTYETSDGVYFDTSKIKDYGKLGQINLEGLREGARIEANSEKRNLTDFALWKFSGKFSEPNIRREQEWKSPWGTGFPGWHIECSAMIKAILGQPIDIHVGGIEHISIHHNNEIAQSESVGNDKLANFWIHFNHIMINGEKISKSTGNVVFLDEIKNPLAYKYWILTSAYNTQANYTVEAVSAADVAYKKLAGFVQNNNLGKVNEKYLKEFITHLENNFDTPRALALIWILIKDNEISNEDKKATILEMDKMLGLGLDKSVTQNLEIPQEIVSLAQERKLARDAKDWAKSDELRQKIEVLGYKITDKDDSYQISLN